jgi:hypothetical protein
VAWQRDCAEVKSLGSRTSTVRTAEQTEIGQFRDHSLPPAKRVARDLGVTHEAVPTSAGRRTRGLWHVRNVNAYHSRFKGWVRRFNGISSRYPTHHLGWFRALESNSRAKAPPSALRVLAIGP